MREILFRGKRIDNEEWVDGLPYKAKFGWVSSIVNDDEERFLVYPDSIGQCTGLTDKNGNNIFEGDIIAGAAHWLERMKNGVVAFKDGSFGLIWYRGNTEQFNAFTSMCNVEYEIIGNIHDNPDLLKGGDDQ